MNCYKVNQANIFRDLIIQKYLPMRDLLHLDKLPAASTNRTIVAINQHQASMAAPAPTTAKLMAIITMLQAQIVALQNAAPAATAAPSAGAATVVFADMPQTLGANDLIDYSKKEGQPFLSKGANHSMTRHLLAALP